MQTGWFSCRSAEQAFIQKALAPFLIHFSVAHTMTSLSMVHVSVWLHWGCMGSKHAWIRPNPDIGMDGRMSPLQIFTPEWKWLVTLVEEVKCPHLGGRGIGRLEDCPTVCQPAYRALVQSGMEQLEDREEFLEATAFAMQLQSLCPYWCKFSFISWWNFIVHSEITITKVWRMHHLGIISNFMAIH